MRMTVLAHLRWDYGINAQTGEPIPMLGAYRPMWTDDTPVCEACWLRAEYIHPVGIDGLMACPGDGDQ